MNECNNDNHTVALVVAMKCGENPSCLPYNEIKLKCAYFHNNAHVNHTRKAYFCIIVCIVEKDREYDSCDHCQLLLNRCLLQYRCSHSPSLPSIQSSVWRPSWPFAQQRKRLPVHDRSRLTFLTDCAIFDFFSSVVVVVDPCRCAKIWVSPVRPSILGSSNAAKMPAHSSWRATATFRRTTTCDRPSTSTG